MCGSENHNEHSCFCSRVCAMIRLLLAGAVLGTIAGMVGMYFFDHDKRIQRNAKRMLEGAEEFTHNIKSKIDETL